MKEKKGQGLVEYAIILAVVAFVAAWYVAHYYATRPLPAAQISIHQQGGDAQAEPDQKELEAPVAAAVQQTLSNVVLNGYQGGTITNWGSIFRCQDGKSTWTSAGGISLTVPGCAGPSKGELHKKLEELDQQAVNEGRDFLRPDIAEWLAATQ